MRTIQETWNGFRDFPLVGRCIELLSTQQPVDLVLRANGAQVATLNDIEQGTRVRLPDDVEPFDVVEITTPANETVKFSVSDGEVEYDPRAQWYDRNASGFTEGFSVEDAAPHVAATRWTRTVAAGKKEYVECASAIALRTAAGAPVGNVEANVRYMPVGGSTRTVIRALFLDNAVGATQNSTLGTSFLMFPGDTLDGQTFDNGTAGTVSYRTLVKGTVFNA